MVYQGRVQGVGFRATAVATAADHRVTGWVKNEPDGSVSLEAQGDAAEVTGYLDAVRERLAGYIRSAEAIEVATETGETGFKVRY